MVAVEEAGRESVTVLYCRDSVTDLLSYLFLRRADTNQSVVQNCVTKTD